MEEFKFDETKLFKIVKLSKNAYLPVKGTPFSAGYDLKSSVDLTIEAGERALVDTDLQFEVPVGTYGRIAPRSGLSYKNCIDVGAGVIDSDYRGQIRILLINNGKQAFNVKKGDKIAQIICEKIKYPILIEVEHLDQTERGENGFGSTG